jgi:hypothetical protein
MFFTAGKAFAQGNGPGKKTGQEQSKKVVVDLSKVPPQKSVTPEAPKVPVPTWPVLGRGRTLEEAEKDALDKAREIVASYLLRQDPPIRWTPPGEFIKHHLLAANPQRLEAEDVEIQIQNQVEKVKMLCWKWTVQVPPSELEVMRAEVARQERHGRAAERMVALGKLTGWAVLALVGVFGYLRVDQWTAGSHRSWLRLALGSLLAGSGVGWWLLS